MSTSNSRRERLRSGLRLGGSITGLAAAGCVTFVYFFSMNLLGYLETPIDWFYMSVPGLIIIGSAVLAWKNPPIGGVVLITLGFLAIIASITIFVVTPGSGVLGELMSFAFIYIALPLSLPLLVAGSLFFLSWRRIAAAPKWSSIGGVTLIIEGLMATAWAVAMVIRLGFDSFLRTLTTFSPWAILWLLIFVLAGLPSLAAGTLLILSWRQERKHLKEAGD